jgi:hypothetical protein
VDQEFPNYSLAAVKKLVLLSAAAAGLIAPSLAQAVPPSITTVAQQSRHLSLTFSAPRADFVTLYVATKPDRATDGRFLQENVVESDSFTDSEIQQGRYLDSSQIDPGTYYLMLNADPDFGCYLSSNQWDAACARGFSDVVKFTIPTPPVRYAATTQRLSFSQRIYVTLRAQPLGMRQAYQVCYRNAAKARRCVRGTLNGFDWGSSATDELSISTRGMAKRTTFQWYVGTRLVASRTTRTA